MEKIRYGIDPHNRLIIEKTGRKTGLPRFRKVLDGKFKVDKNNTLTYHVKAPLAKDTGVPSQVKFRGKWSLTKNHNLRVTLDKWKRQTFGDQLTFQGDIIDVNKNALLFSVTTRTKEGAQSVYILRFQGTWQADKYNRLIFKVKKERGKHDILLFNSAWRLNKNYQIVYQYQKARLLRKSKKIHTITFKGYWNITDKMRILYEIDRNTNSVFHFKSSLGIFTGKYIKYEIGIRLSRRRKPAKRTVTLFGAWKIKKNLALAFTVQYGNKKTRSIAFSAKFSRKILKEKGEVFLRLLKSNRKSSVLIGAAFGW